VLSFAAVLPSVRAVLRSPPSAAIFAALALLAVAPAARAAELVRVVQAIDGDTVAIERAVDGAKEIRLVGIQAPKLPLGRKGFTAWPLADDARAALEEIARDREVLPIATGRSKDRHGRLLAHLERDDDGLWLQGEMLRRGLARVYTFADNRARAKEMLALEGEARAAGRGIWRNPYYRIRAADRIAEADLGTFQLIEGRVVEAARVKDRVYLNFGADHRSDFTITVAARTMPLFAESGIDPLRLEGRRLRIRGWLDNFGGPVIEATHPEQIELLSD
jgi:endonuclease YncB( thermonuclease family)